MQIGAGMRRGEKSVSRAVRASMENFYVPNLYQGIKFLDKQDGGVIQVIKFRNMYGKSIH